MHKDNKLKLNTSNMPTFFKTFASEGQWKHLGLKSADLPAIFFLVEFSLPFSVQWLGIDFTDSPFWAKPPAG